MASLLAETPVLTIFLILFFGLAMGSIKVRGLKLGASGVLFAALIAGHFGAEIPPIVQNFGLALFVLSVGLQAGPRFFRILKARGAAFSAVAVVIATSAAALAFAAAYFFDYPIGLTVGLMTGALTSTPGLAAALEATGDPAASVGYGLAYPFGVAAVVLFVQLIPGLKPESLQEEDDQLAVEEDKPGQDTEKLISVAFRVENPEVHRSMLGELPVRDIADVRVSRIFRSQRSFIGRGDAVLLKGDRVIVVGPPEEIDRLGEFFGPRVDFQPAEDGGATVSRVIMNRSELEDKTLRELNLTRNYGVLLTRIQRSGVEIYATPDTSLEEGDVCTLVGSEPAIADVQRFFASDELRVGEVDLLPISAYVLAGILIGLLPIPLPGGGTVSLGFAGGPLFVGLIASHFGRIGPLRARFDSSGLGTVNSLGLVLFLLGAGVSAGAGLLEVMQVHGPGLFGVGVVMTLVPMLAAYLVARTAFGLGVIYTLGCICGGMTSTPGLGALDDLTDTDEPTLAYAAVYPLALILVAVFSQVLAVLL